VATGAAVALLLAASMAAPSAQQAAPTPPAGQTGTVQVATVEPPPPPPEGVIAGRVLDAMTKLPIERARVLVSADCETPSTDDKPCKKVLENNQIVLTDTEGRYRFAQLPAGTTYVVTARYTGYAAQAFGELPPSAGGRLIPLQEKQVLENVNIELAPHVVLAGAVQDEDGKPFAGALVEALRATYIDGRRELLTVAEAITDDRGEFRLSHMAPGQYYVGASDPAFANVGDASGPLYWPTTYYPSASTPEEATRITLDPGVAKEAILIKLRIMRPSRVGGKLKPSGEQELTAGAIELGPRLADQNMSLSNHQADIRPDGTFLFANVSSGRYVIRARGEAPALPQAMFGSYTLDVAGVDRLNVEVNMSPGAILSGTVVWEGRARPPADRSSIVVRAPMTDGSLSGDAVTGNLQPDDTFRLRGVGQGIHYIRVEGLREPWVLKRVELKGADITDIETEFRSGQEETEMRLIFTDQTTQVGGIVQIGSRDVMHGYAVVAFSMNPTTWFPRSRFVALQRPNLRGQFVFRGLPPGEYFLMATREVDEGDLGSKVALQQLADTPGIQRFSIKDGERKMHDLRAVIRRPVPVPLLNP
jgi:hypothetical protein